MQIHTLDNSEIDRVIKTHVSTLYFAGDTVFKIKNNISLAPYISYENIRQRRTAIHREYLKGAKYSPGLYRGVCCIQLDNSVTPEPCLMMRRFRRNEITVYEWLQTTSIVSEKTYRSLFSRISCFHTRTKIAQIDAKKALSNLQETFNSIINESSANKLTNESIFRWEEYVRQFLFCTYEKGLNKRINGGFIRELHGDLHTNNVLISNGNLLPFDFLDFPYKFVNGDILIDISFFIIDFCANRTEDIPFIIDLAVDVFMVSKEMLIPFLIHASLVRYVTFNYINKKDTSLSYYCISQYLLELK